MKQSRTSSVWTSLLSVGALVGLVACTPEASAPSGADAQEAAEASEAALEAGPEAEAPRAERRGHGMKHGGHHEKGPLALFRHALEELELDEAQKQTIDAELAALEAARPDMKPGFAKHQAALAAAVRSGSVDRDALVAELGESQHAEMRARMNAALGKLHATLRPEQRKALSDAVIAKMDAHAERRAERGDGERRGGKRFGKGPGSGGMGERGPMGHLVGELELSDEQRAKIDAALEALRDAKGARGERFEEHHAAMRKAAEAFAGERFDASAFGPPDAELRGPGAMMIDAVAAIVPVLDEAQREALAKRIEAGPPEHGARGKRGPRRGPGAPGDTSL